MVAGRRIIWVLVALVAIGLAIVGIAHAMTPSPEDWPYVVEERPNGNLRVYVTVDMEDPSEREAYARQQRSAAVALARSRVGPVPVQVTFRRPLSVAEVRELAQQTGLIPEAVICEARDAAGGLCSAGAACTEGGLEDLEERLEPGLQIRGLRLMGVMVVQGVVPASPEGVGRLAVDERVYLPDVMRYLLAHRLAPRYRVDVSKVQVAVPSPYWELSSER
ncbi:MAG: hypothetical protein QME94_05540 [Anaerolineae bacterium]|nr:hypothetical protein [Anaerolineae bacterium]